MVRGRGKPSAGARATLLLLLALVAGPLTARSDVVALHIFPASGTMTASPDTQITLRGTSIDQIDDVRVVGSITGIHSGSLLAHSDGDGASFVPDEPFTPGESVLVAPTVTGATATEPGQFIVSRPVPQSEMRAKTVLPGAKGWQSFRSRPEMRMPTISIRQAATDRSSGLMLLTQSAGPSGSAAVIADYAGNITWFHPLPEGVSALNLRADTYLGKPVLTWWEGALGRGKGFGETVVADSSYREIARIGTGNGYLSDLHDFQFARDGSALQLIYAPIRWNLSSVGGPVDGVAWDNIVQQIDVATGLVTFEWHSLDHVALSESVEPLPESAETGYDYFHVNSVEADGDDAVIISARHTNAIYRIDRGTGDVLWRLGGTRSDFEMPDDAKFGYQHDARRLPNGNLTLFDNAEKTDKKGASSSALELALDEQSMTATTVRRDVHPGRGLSTSQGSARRLPNGFTFVGWGHQPAFTEFDDRGRVVFDATFAPGESYRAFRQPWVGRPVARPDAVIERSGRTVTAYVSWNGDTRTTTWELLAGSGTRTLRVVARAKRAGFETVLRARTPATRFLLRARDASGRAIGGTVLLTAR